MNDADSGDFLSLALFPVLRNTIGNSWLLPKNLTNYSTVFEHKDF